MRRSCFAQGLRLLDIELLNAGRGQRKCLDVDARRVHRRDAAVVNVEELSDQGREPPAGPFRLLLQPVGRTFEISRRGEMFLKGDRAHEHSYGEQNVSR